MFSRTASSEPQSESYDTMKLGVIRNSDGTFDLGVGLYIRSERRYYREYQKQFSTYLDALEYLKERVVVYQKANGFHRLQLNISYNLQSPQWECPNSEKGLTTAQAA
jgi:hypothetical protein